MSAVKTQQILIPKQVYIGDTAELRCSFNSGNQNLQTLFLQDSSRNQSGVQKELSFDIFTQDFDTDALEVKKVTLSPSGVDFYQLTITFVPWKTDSLEIPPVQIEDTLLEFEPVQISSLIESENQTALKDGLPPMLLPGTTYRIYAAVIIFVLVLILFFRMIAKRRTLSFRIKNLILKIKCHHNKKITEKKLTALLSMDNISDKQWAEGVQKIIRKYLCVKYQLDFFKLTSSEIMSAFLELTGGVLEEKTEAMARITEIFVRTDFIRYSSKSSLLENERKELTDELFRLISQMEGAEND